ncbi:Uncharacterised protein [Vibrio cholerae]|nr:Uncharacterised protein [Vibrio cholerae]
MKHQTGCFYVVRPAGKNQQVRRRKWPAQNRDKSGQGRTAPSVPKSRSAVSS